MGFKLIYNGCCLQWVQYEPLILLGSYTTEDSSGNPIIDPYKPYVNEQNPDFFYVKEDYDMDGQPTPHKHSEDSTAPELNAMSYFVGVQDNGDGTHTNYNFTPAQLIAYVTPEIRTPMVLDTETDTFWRAGTTPSLYISSTAGTVMNQTAEEGGGYDEVEETVGGVQGYRITRNDTGTWLGKIVIQK